MLIAAYVQILAMLPLRGDKRKGLAERQCICFSIHAEQAELHQQVQRTMEALQQGQDSPLRAPSLDGPQRARTVRQPRMLCRETL